MVCSNNNKNKNKWTELSKCRSTEYYAGLGNETDEKKLGLVAVL